MSRYVLTRLANSLITLILLVIALFFLMHLLGDPIVLILGDQYTEEQYQAVAARYGYDRPLLVQFASYMVSVLTLDFGESIRFAQPAVELVFTRLPSTLFLGAAALLISLVGIPMGIAAARRPRSLVDNVVNSASFGAMSAPNFWIALIGIYVFAVTLGILPTSGFEGFGLAGLPFLVLPAIVLSLNGLGRFAQFTRTAVMEELSRNYVQAARSKGLRERTIMWVHVMKNAGISIVTLAGDELASILNGSVIIETVFGWPGVGSLMIVAIRQRDLPLVVASVVIVVLLVMVTNFLVDMAYARLDPRIRYQ